LAPIRKVGSRLLNQEQRIDASGPAAAGTGAGDGDGDGNPTAGVAASASGAPTAVTGVHPTDAGSAKPSLDRAHPA
jgi:hypothetical protein